MHGGKGAPREAHRGRIPNLDYMPPFFVDRNGECPVLPDAARNQNIAASYRKRCELFWRGAWPCMHLCVGVASEKRALHKAVVTDLTNGMRDALGARIEECEKRVKNSRIAGKWLERSSY